MASITITTMMVSPTLRTRGLTVDAPSQRPLASVQPNNVVSVQLLLKLGEYDPSLRTGARLFRVPES